MELRGRKIGLHRDMNAEAMYNHLCKISKEWEDEGHSKTDVFQAICSKVRPLIYNYYWNGYPEAQAILATEFSKFTLHYMGTVSEFSSPKNTKPKQPDQPKEELPADFLAQFKV